jgi:DNA-binding CsgD family transcriptional regulator
LEGARKQMLKYQNSGVRNGPLGEEARLVAVLRQQKNARIARAAFDVLDLLSAGVILLDRHARVLHVNEAAQSLGSDGGILKLHETSIATWWPVHSQRLDSLIRAALRGAPAASMSVPRPRDGQFLTILVSSVQDRHGPCVVDLGMEDAAVLLFVVDPAGRTGVPVEWLIDAYGLTPAEARVALAVSSGRTIPETASQLGSSPNTIKTHLRAVFAKTGVTGKAGLTRLVASIGMFAAKGTPPTVDTRALRRAESCG